MRKLLRACTILIAFYIYSLAIPESLSAQQMQGFVSFQIFYDQLSPYGQWVNYPNYDYVWIPNVSRGFSPYSTDGHWVMTDYGWTWVSDYPWGWAPFHYGRWDYDNYYGWFWVPDNEWGPSWVTWRSGNGYYGWAPMRPGISITLSFNSGYADMDRWNFVRYRDFGRSNIDRYYINRSQNNTIFSSSVVINNTYEDKRRNSTYISGPTLNQVKRDTGRKINRVSIQDYDRPGQKMNKNQLQIYRPRVERTNDQGQRPTPPKVTDREDIKPLQERNGSNRGNEVSPNQKYKNRSEAQPRNQTEPRRQEQNKQMQPRQQKDKLEQGQPQKQDQIRNGREQQKGMNREEALPQSQKKEQVHRPAEKQKQSVTTPQSNKKAAEQQKKANQSKKGKTKDSDKKSKKEPGK